MKKKYFIEFTYDFSDSLEGVVEMTDEEYETVRRVMNPRNWEDAEWMADILDKRFRIIPLEEREKELEPYIIERAIQDCDWDNPPRLCAGCPAEGVCRVKEYLDDD